MSKIPFVCPKCGGNQFKVSSPQGKLDDMIGAPCSGCGIPLTKDEIEKQARKIAEEVAKKAFKNLKF